MRGKSEDLEKIQKFIAEHGIPNVLRSDISKELTSKHFKQYCIENEIKHELKVLETPEQNGVAAKAKRTIVEMARCLLIQAQKLAKKLLVESYCNCLFFEKPCRH